ncbi:hypothetical protein L484_025894 [Morus notabilis]|uniref:Retrotransposon gag domain-containing protein n=1 Tax=Morus notabilis TaxID=981085 RepID=W9R2T7_9ROSA|nr:hypothetical protein L484_025894 [Morus notabilis]
MVDRQVLLRFAQQDSEPFFSAWERYKEQLIQFPDHGFLREVQLQIFLDGLDAATRMWVERGNGTTSFHQLSADEAYWWLEDMTDVNYWYGKYSTNHHDFEDSSNISEPWLDTPRHHAESSTSLEDLVAQFSKETRLRIEKLERIEVLNQLHEEIKTNLAELFRLKLLPDESTNAMNRETQEEDWELFEDDSLREEETQGLVSEEFQEDVNESQSLEIPIVVPPPVEKDHIYEDPMWPATPLPSRAPFFHANQVHMPAPSQVEQIIQKLPNLAKLEGVKNQDPYVMLYDTYYGRKPLFDELARHRNN